MTTRKKQTGRGAARKAGKTPAPKPVAATGEKPARELLPEKWVTAKVIDVEQGAPMRSGAANVTIELEVTKPRLYAGRSLYHRVSGHLEKTLDSYAERFPGVNFLDAEQVWDAIGGQLVRANVQVEDARVDEETGEVYPKRNRVASIHPGDGRDVAPEEPADEEFA